MCVCDRTYYDAPHAPRLRCFSRSVIVWLDKHNQQTGEPAASRDRQPLSSAADASVVPRAPGNWYWAARPRQGCRTPGCPCRDGCGSGGGSGETTSTVRVITRTFRTFRTCKWPPTASYEVSCGRPSETKVELPRVDVLLALLQDRQTRRGCREVRASANNSFLKGSRGRSGDAG